MHHHGMDNYIADEGLDGLSCIKFVALHNAPGPVAVASCPRARTGLGRSCGPSLGFMPVQGVQGRMQTFQHSTTAFCYGVQGVQGTITRFLHFYFSVSIN